MSYENKTGINVTSQYGTRNTGLTAGFDDDFDELTFEITAKALNDGLFLPPIYLPKGARVQRATLHIDNPITLTGTSPTLQIGGTAPGTNGITLAAADLSAAAGAYDVASKLTGTWATNSTAGIANTEKTTVALGGTNPAVTVDNGKATLWIEFRFKKRT